MPAPLRKRTLTAAVVLTLAVFAAAGLAACGEDTKVTTGTYAGESGKNAPYLDVGPLKYEVQLSRELNPANTEDSNYLEGLTAEQAKLGPGEEWFAVFIQVYNNTHPPQPSASKISITDTQENTYTPIEPSAVNRYAYRPAEVPGNGQLPLPNSVAYDGPTQGALLLFKIKVVSLDNRPLTIKIVNPTNSVESASAELDV
jgi:hypothetical protein